MWLLHCLFLTSVAVLRREAGDPLNRKKPRGERRLRFHAIYRTGDSDVGGTYADRVRLEFPDLHSALSKEGMCEDEITTRGILAECFQTRSEKVHHLVLRQSPGFPCAHTQQR